MSLLLLHPPAAKASEPPAGIARLVGTLRSSGISCTPLDLNLSCTLELIDQTIVSGDTWSQRAGKNRDRHLRMLRSDEARKSFDTYVRTVHDLNRLLEISGKSAGVGLSLSNYLDPARSPLASSDLLQSSRCFAKNLYYPLFSRILDQELAINRYQYLGLSINYLSQALTAFAIAGFIRAEYPKLKLIAGGGLITSWLRKPGWSDPFKSVFDRCIGGCGEKPLLDYLTGNHTGGLKSVPDYSDFPLSEYLSPGITIPYSTADGCYWNKCRFCPDQAEKNPYTPRKPATVLTQIHDLCQSHQPKLLHLLDNAIPPATLRALAADPPGPAWYGFVRAERLLLDQAFCTELAKAGCVMLKIGVESGSQQVLDQMNKGIRLERVSRILENLSRAQIATYVYLLFGTPYETESQARQTLHFVNQNIDHICYLNLAIFNLPEGSNPAICLSDGRRMEDLSLYQNFSHPHGWDRHQVRRFVQTQFKRNTRIAQLLQNDPPTFTSNHAPFFTVGYQGHNTPFTRASRV